MTPEEIIEKWKSDHNFSLSDDEIRILGSAGTRKAFELCLEDPEFRKAIIDGYMYFELCLEDPEFRKAIIDGYMYVVDNFLWGRFIPIPPV